MTPDVIYDQMIAAGVARRLVFSYLGNPGVGPLNCIRRAVEQGIPSPLEIEEYSHFGMVGRYIAGAARLRSTRSVPTSVSEMPESTRGSSSSGVPTVTKEVAVVPPLNPDVLSSTHSGPIPTGNTPGVGGCLVCRRKSHLPQAKSIVVVEELVDESVIRADPNRTLIPGLIVDAVVHEPFGAHPSYVQGYYDRDNAFYLEWTTISRNQAATESWLEKWVYGVADRAEYTRRLGQETVGRLKPVASFSAPVNYGSHQ